MPTVAALLIAVVLVALPQEPGDLTGRITDAASGTSVAGADVFIPGLEIGGRTNREGHFLIRGVEGDSIQVVVEHSCFHRVRVDVVLDQAGVPLEIGLPLKVATTPSRDAAPLGSCERLWGR